MFSVGDDDGFRTNPFAPYIRAGIKMVNFDYQGGQATAAGSLSLSGTAAHITFESGGFNLNASLANQLLGMEDQDYFGLELNFTNPIYLLRNSNYLVGIPIQLNSKITSVRNDAASYDFSQTNLSAGLGAVVQLHFPQKLGATIQFIPQYGFSSSSGGFIGGNVFSLSGKARLNFYNLIFGKNLSLGYDYSFDSYDIDEEQYDYDLTGHTLTLGISL